MISLSAAQQLEDISEEAFLEKNGVQIVRDMQKLQGVDEEEGQNPSGPQSQAGRRRTLAYLEEQPTQRQATGNLDMAFRKRLMSIAPDAGLDGMFFFHLFNYKKKSFFYSNWKVSNVWRRIRKK